MKLKKYSLFIMKTIIAIIFLLILFYFMSVLIVGEKKTLNNDFAKSFKDDKGIYISQVFDNYKIFLNENYVKDNKNLLFYDGEQSIKNSFISFFDYGETSFDYLNNLKKKLISTYGGNWDILNNLSVGNEGFLLFSSVRKQSLFDYSFDLTIDLNGFGINGKSDSLLIGLIKKEYEIDENNYCFSIVDDDGDKIIFMKNKNFSSYEEAWKYYQVNKNEDSRFLLGEDSIVFKRIKISQLGLIPELENYKINDMIKIDNFYIYSNIVINGLGAKETINKNKNILDEHNIKFNFLENSILFIVKDGEISPYFAYKY